MRKRVQIALAVLAAAVAGLIGLQVHRPREPVYQGKGLREWLSQYRSGLNTGDEQQVRAGETAEGAIRQFGTNAIPTLLKMLVEKDSPVVSGLLKLPNRHLFRLPRWVGYPGLYENQAAFLNDNAALGFRILGADAQQAAPALIEIYERNISPDSQAATSRALIAIGPAAGRMAVVSFLRNAGSSNEPVREIAVRALSGLDAEPRLVVPALVNALSDTNLIIRLVAARGLGHFGTNAQLAVPTLLLLLTDRSSQVRAHATKALQQIDPEAATQAGVK